MSTYAVTTSTLSGVVPGVNLPQFGANYSAIIESVAPTSILNHSTINVFESSLANTTNLTPGVITTHIVVDIVQRGSNVTATEVPMVDSIPPRITINTVQGSGRPQEITQAEPETTTGSPAADGRSDASRPSRETRLD
ncbi:hypothetical protein F5Y06DRAFT_149600 [Hypoxylon sp. FL0890]|nr:hypothetical protein F5Y06DRAFT_149600 [Hypoxylon sp. FL0890]